MYISEAHAQDEWALYKDVCFDQPKSLGQRVGLAEQFASRLYSDSGIPLVVDTMSNAAEAAFGAWPERLYVVGADGRIAFKGDLGPDGYKPELVGEWLETYKQSTA